MQHHTTDDQTDIDHGLTITLDDPDDVAPGHVVDAISLGFTDPIELGASVEVRRRFDHAWARGFEVASAVDDGYRLRRRSDGAVLPVSFPADDVRRSSAIHLP